MVLAVCVRVALLAWLMQLRPCGGASKFQVCCAIFSIFFGFIFLNVAIATYIT